MEEVFEEILQNAGMSGIREKVNFKLKGDAKTYPTQMAYQILKIDNNFNILQLHIDMMVNFIDKKIDKINNKISELFDEIYNNYNIKSLALIEEFTRVQEEYASCTYDLNQENIEKIARVIVYMHILKDILKDDSDHSWIKEDLTYNNIINNKEIYRNGKFKIYFENGYIVLFDKIKKEVFKVQIREVEGELVLNKQF